MKPLTRILLAACVLSTGIAAAATAPKIRFDGFPDFDSSLKKILPAFEKESGIEVTYLMNNHEDHHKKLITNLATGSGAGDVVAIDVAKVGAFVNSGGLVNLSKQFNADQYESLFAPYAWAQGKGVDGDVYGIPVDLGPGVMYYRRDLIDDQGYNIDDIVRDWDSYITFGKELKKKGIYLISSAADVADAIIMTTVKEGNGLYFDAKGEPLVTNERFVEAFTKAKAIRDAGLDARIKSWTNEWYEGFKNGAFATQLSGAWLMGHLKNWIAPKTAGKWGVSNLPNHVYGSWGGSFLSIPTQSKHQQEAWKLIVYMTTRKDVQLEAFKTIAAFPSNTTTYSDPMFDEAIPFLRGQKARELFAEIAQRVKPVLPSRGDQVARSIIMDNALMEVLDEGKDVKQALADAQRMIKRRTRNL